MPSILHFVHDFTVKFIVHSFCLKYTFLLFVFVGARSIVCFAFLSLLSHLFRSALTVPDVVLRRLEVNDEGLDWQGKERHGCEIMAFSMLRES